jgi:DNA-binding NarL/FixJ family response regulator
MELSDKSRVILEAIAEGHSYEQILSSNPKLTYNDIFRAAAEVLETLDQPAKGKTYEQRMVEIRQAHPRAYEKWSTEEDARLTEFFRKGIVVKEIAKTLQRQPSAIRSRLAKLNLVVSGQDFTAQ